MDIKVGDIVECSNDYEGAMEVEVLDVVDDISEYCGLEPGPGFWGMTLRDEWGVNVSKDGIELCWSKDDVTRIVYSE